MSRFFWRSVLGPLLVLALVCGCGAKEEGPPPKENYVLKLTFSADPDMNPDGRGGQSALAVRVFALSATDAFEGADYFALQTDAKKTLEETLVEDVFRFVIRPGERQTIPLSEAPPGVSYLGFIAGYKDIYSTVWQSLYQLPPAPEQSWLSSPVAIRLEIRLTRFGLEIIEPTGNR